jgi:outer membrane murein-binding lipoprotein Lpp
MDQDWHDGGNPLKRGLVLEKSVAIAASPLKGNTIMILSKPGVFIVLVGSTLLFGCATTSQQDALRAEIDDIRAIAEQAATDAVAARQQAASAQSSADAARATADQAAERSAATDTRIDRMFKKAMYK